MQRLNIALVVLALTGSAGADDFTWLVDSNASVLTTTISATLGSTLSDSETNKVSGFLGGELALPTYTFGTIHLTRADLGYTTNPSFSLTQPFVGGVNIVGSGLGFALPGANNLGFASPNPAIVGLDGTFSQVGNGAEGRGTLTYTGVGLLGSSLGTGTISLLEQSPLPLDFNGTVAQTGNQLKVTLPISIDQTTTQNNIPVRVQITGNVVAYATTTANGWKANVDGDWNTQANWVANTGVPGAAGQTTFDTAVFGDFGTNATRTISVSSPLSPRRVLVAAGATGQYRFTGTQPITLTPGSGSASLSVLSGEGRFDLPVALPTASTAHVEGGATLTLSNVTSTASSTLSKTGTGGLTIAAGDIGVVNVNGGLVQFISPTPTARVASLNISPAGSVSIADTLVIENQQGGLAQVAAYLKAGLTGTPGGGIQPAAAGRNGFGEKVNAGLNQAGSFVLSDTSIVVRVTVVGDANLDRIVNFDDLLRLAQSYGNSGFWFNGDFDYDLDVDFDDLLGLAQNYGSSLSADEQARVGESFAADFALARSLVPEPMMLAVLPAFLSRRRRL